MTLERPSGELLRSFLAGKESAEQRAVIAAYLDAHPEVLNELILADDADSFISDLLKPVAHFSSEPAFREGLQRVRALGTKAPDAPFPDQVGRFRLLQRINRSGSSAVYRATDQSSGELVALKILSVQRLHEPLAVSRFRREMSLVGKMHHPNLVRLIDSGEADGILFVVMELLTGCDLSQLVEKVGPIPIESASALVEQTAMALEYASQNSMVHRDVKPSNIFLTETGEVKLLDLGLVRLLTDEDESLSRSDQLLGTVDYMAPEQAFDTRQADVRSDIYSLGCTFYKLLTGHAPFSGPQYMHLLKKVLAHSSHEMRPIQGLRPDCPNALAAILERMCAKRPDDRCQCPGEVIEAVATFANREALRTLAECYRDLSVSGQAPSRQKEAKLEVTAGPVQSGNPISAAERPPFTTRSQRTSLVVAAGLTSTAILAAGLLKPSSDHQINGTASPTAELKTPTDMVKPATYDQGPENIAADSVVPVVPETDRITLESPYSGIWCINASALGTQICSGSNDGGIRIWNSAGQKVAEFRRSLETDHPVHAFALTPDGKQCLAVGFPPYVALWDVPTQRIVREFSGHTDRVWAVSISSDGGTAASAGWDGTIRIWDLHTGASIRTIEAQMGKVLAVSFLPNSDLLVAAGRARVTLMDTRTGKQKWSFHGYPLYASAVAVSADGSRIAVGGRDNSLRLLNAENGDEIHVLKGHNGWVNATAFSTDGQWILSGSSDLTVRLWNAASGEPVCTYSGHAASVNAVSFLATKPLAVSGSEDRTIRFWPLPKSTPP
ncbi:MAG: WD40 repeat domain-containing serine/threonine protein kinase [Planctomycetaceae bacterium]